MAAAAVDRQNQLLQDEANIEHDDVTFESNGLEEPVSSANFDFWSNHTGMKIKQFSDEELLAFRKPFQLGWRREVVLRGTVTNSGRKIGDVYYFSPDKKIKLRSYVEMGLFLKKNSQCGLEPENFTFARQPIYEPPAEIVRPAQSRGSNQPADVDCPGMAPPAPLTPSATITFTTPTDVPSRKEYDRYTAVQPPTVTTPDDGSSLVEGRSKRKRVAPARFEDEDFAEQSPIKKKPLAIKAEKTSCAQSPQVTPPIKISIKPPPSGGGKIPMIVTPVVSHTPKQVTLKPAAPRSKEEAPKTVPSMTIVKTEVASEQSSNTLAEQSKVVNPISESVNQNNGEKKEKPPTSSNYVTITVTSQPQSQPQPLTRPMISKPSLLEKNLTRQFKPIKPKPAPVEMIPVAVLRRQSPLDGGKAMVPPCSIMCGDQQGQLPSLLCSRCLCLFHPSCVPNGMYLDEANDFVCPNCIQNGDKGSPVKISNGKIDEDNHMDVSSISESSPLPLKMCSPSRNSSRASSPAPFVLSALKSRLSLPVVRKSTPEQRFMAQLKLLQKYQQQTALNVYRSAASPVKSTRDNLRVNLTDTSTPLSNKKQRIIKSKGGHFQIDHPMFNQSKHDPGSKSTSILPPGLLSKGQHLQMSKIIQNQLQAFYQPTPIAPIAPIRVTPAQVATILNQKTRNKYREYLTKNYPGINTLLGGYSFLSDALEYLTHRDLVSLSGVNRAFKGLSSQPHLWVKLRLRGITITDWQAFGEKVVEYKSTEIDFEGVRIPTGTDLSAYWTQFSAFIPFLLSVTKLKFGTIPKTVLEELSRSQIKFKSIVIKNIYEENSLKKEASLSVLDHFRTMTSLEEVQVSCKSGLKVDETTPESLCSIFSPLLKLNHLSLTNMNGLTKEHFQFLEELSHLSSLEIGSCESWNDSRNPEEGVTIPFKYFQNMVRLQHLKLIDLIIDETSGDLPVVMHHMRQLKSLSLESVTMSSDSQEILDVLAQTINNDLDELKSLTLSTDDPLTNRLVIDVIKKLDNLDHLTWKVGTFVEDSGECVIPLSMERSDDSELDGEMDLMNGHENLETIDVVSLTEQLDEHLPRTKVEILPQ